MLLKEEAYLGKCQSGIRTSSKHKKELIWNIKQLYKVTTGARFSL